MIKTTIDGVSISARKEDGWIFWASAWEKIYDLVKLDYARMEYYPNCYGHCSFFLND